MKGGRNVKDEEDVFIIIIKRRGGILESHLMFFVEQRKRE